MGEPLLTTDSVATMLGFKVTTIRRYVREGKLPHVRVGNIIRIRKEDVDKFVEERYGHGNPDKAN